MSKYSNTIQYNLRTTLDSSGIAKLQTELVNTTNKIREMNNQSLISDEKTSQAISSIQKVQAALNKSFNSKLGMLDISKFQKEIGNTNGLVGLQKSLTNIGSVGTTAFNSILGSLGKVDTGVKATSSLIDKMANTMGNTVRWGIMSSAFNGVTDSLRQSVDYAKTLDDSLTQIMLVTNYSKNDMNEYAKKANEAAKSLGATTTDMTNSALIFAQQGFDLNKSQQLAEYSTKLANASQQDTAATSDQITAYMNAYGLDNSIDGLKKALDSWAEVANVSAADVGELAEASQKSASAAATLGVSTDQLNAQIATIESVTREAPEQIGNGLKTLFARFSDIQLGKTLDDGISLGDVTQVLNNIGVNPMDENGNLRGVGDIMEDLMKVWSSIDSTQKAAVSQTLAGKYQLARFEALMNRSDLYDQYKGASENASGTLDVMNEKYVDSLEGRLNKLQATGESIFNNLFQTDDFYGPIDALTQLVDLANQFVQAIGGMSGGLKMLAPIMTQVFSKQIGQGISGIITNISSSRLQKNNRNEAYNKLQEMGLQDVRNDSNKEIVDLMSGGLRNARYMNDDMQQAYNNTLQSTVDAKNDNLNAEQALRDAVESTNALYKLRSDMLNSEQQQMKELIALEQDEQGNIVANTKELNNVKENKGWLLGSDNISQSNLDSLKTSLIQTRNSYDDETRASAIELMKNTHGTLEDFLNTQEGQEGLAALKTTIESADGALKDLQNTFGSSSTIAKKFAKNIRDAEDSLETIANEKDYSCVAQLESEIAELGGTLEELSGTVNQVKLDKIADDTGIEKLNSQVTVTGSLVDSLKSKAISMVQSFDLTAAITNVANIAGGLTNIVFGLQQIAEIPTIWDDDNLTSAEKMTQTIISLGMALPMIANGLSSFSVIIDAFKGGVFAESVINLANSFKGVTTASTAAAAATEAVGVASSSAATGVAAAATAETAAGTAAAAATPAITTFGTALLTLAGPILGVVALIGGIVLGAKSLYDWFNKDAIAADKAADAASNVSTAYQEAKNSAETLSNTIDSYKESRENLNNLTKGTQEWNEALADTNEQAASLLEKFPELSKYMSRNANGQLEISSEGLDKLNQSKQTSLAYDALAVAKANQAADEAKQASDETELRRKLRVTDTKEVVKTQSTNPDTYGVSGISHSSPSSYKTTDTFDRDLSVAELNKIYDLIKSQGADSLTDTKAISDTLGVEKDNQIVDAIKSNASSIIAAYNNKQNTSNNDNVQLQNAAQQALNTIDEYDVSNRDNNLVVADVANNASQMMDKLEAQYQKYSNEELGQLYADNHPGWTYKKTKDGKAIFEDANGQEQTIDKDTMSTMLAAGEAMQKAASDWSNSADRVAMVAESAFSKKYGDEYTTTVTNGTKDNGFDFSNWHKSDLKQIASNDNLSASDLGVNDTFAQNAGFKDGQDYADAFLKAAKEQLSSLDSAKLLENDTNSLDEDEIKSTLSNVGADADKLSEYQENLKANDSQINDFADSISNSNNELSQQNQELENANKNLSASSDEWKANKRQIEANNKAIDKNNDAYDSITTKLIEAQEGADKLRDIFDDSKNTLENAAQGTADYNDAINNLSDGVSKLLNIDMSGWSNELKDSFITENLDNIQKAANGDTEALQNLRDAAAQAIIVNADINPDSKASIQQQMADLIETCNTELPTIEAGAEIDDEQFYAQLTAMIKAAQAAGMTMNDIMDMMDGLGIEADMEMVATPYTSVIDVPTFEARGAGSDSANGLQQEKLATKAYMKATTLSGSATVPKWTFRKKSNNVGKKTYNSGSGGGHSVNNGSGGSGGKGGSGGSGSGSSYTPKEKDEIEDEVDRYEKVQTKLDSIANDYSKIDKEQSRLTGSKLAANLAEQNDLLEKQIQLQKEKLEIQKKEQQELQGKLGTYGIQFDSEGFMTNYSQIHQSLIDNVNNLIKQYNATSSEEGQDSLEKQIDEAQKKLDKFTDQYQRYDELISSDMKDTISSIEDLQDAIEDLHIQVLKTQISALDNIKSIQEALIEFDRAFNRGIELTPYEEAVDNIAKLGKYFDIATGNMDEYYDKLIENSTKAMNATGVSETAKNFYAQQIQGYQEAKANQGKETLEQYGTGYLDMSLKNVADIQEQIRQFEETGTSSIFGEDSADLYDVAKTVFDQATGAVKDYWSLIEDLHDNITDMIDDIGDKLDRRKEQYEAITDELEHQADIIELIHGDEAYDQLNYALGAQQHNYQSEIADLQKQVDLWKDMLLSMQEGSEEWNTVSDKIKDATSEINDLIQNSLENLQKQYTNTVNKITKAWGSSAMGTDLDWMSTQWELINRNADYYLDDVNKAYNIQKLQGKYLDLLDGSNDLSIQQKISAQMKEQLSYLRDKTKLSEYDVNYANAQLEILQKQIALEEAQRNKSQMKLRRDTQGNYSYVYTANEGDVSSAQSDLLDAQNNAYNLSKNQMKQTQDDSLSALKDAQSTINDIWNNANLTLEEKKERTQTIIDSLKEYLASTSEQLSTSEKNIINDFIGMCDALTGENKEGLQDVYDQIVSGNKDAFDQIDTRWQTSITTWLQNLDTFNENTDKAFSDLISNAEDYQKKIDDVGSLVKKDFNDMSGSVDNLKDKTDELNKSTEEFFNKMKDMSGEVKKGEEAMNYYAEKIQDANNNMRAFQEQVDDLGNKLTAKEQENANLQNQLQKAQSDLQNVYGNNGAGGANGGGGAGGAANSATAWGIAQSIWTYGARSGWGNDPIRSSKLTKGYGTDFARQVQSMINAHTRDGSLVNYDSMKYSSYSLLGYDTGGYTGDWASSEDSMDSKGGKLAILHSKEIVLNPDDTENLLAAISMVRQYVNTIGNNFSNLSSYYDQVNKLSSALGDNGVSQEIIINADFPAANSAAEIREALESLNDRALQYAYKTR